MDRVTLEQIRACLAVVETGTFSGAGRRLGKVQSAISQAVALLEDALGVEVFDRAAGRRKLTEQGEALLVEMRAVLGALDELGARAQAMRGGAEPELSIACDAVFPTDVLVEVCRRFQVAFPRVSLRVESDVLGAVARRVEDGACLLGVVGPSSTSGSSLLRTHIGQVRMLPVVAPHHPLARRTPSSGELRQHVQIVLQSHTGEAGPDQAVLSERPWRVVDLATKHALLTAGLGWGNLPEHRIADDLASGVLVRLDVAAWGPQTHCLDLSVVHRADRGLGPAARWAMQELQRQCAEPSAGDSQDEGT